MKKPSATVEIRRRHDHLTAMAARGTTHEKSVAKEKILRLEGKYDFSAEADIGDVFAKWLRPSYSHISYPVLKIKKEGLDTANLIKWVFQDQFGTSSSWKTLPEGTVLMLHAKESDVKRLKPFAKRLHDTIVAVCAEFSHGRNIRALDLAPFLNGLYDGLIDETRPHGTTVPGFSPTAKKKLGRAKKPKKSEALAGSSASIHPYDLGRDAGKKLRADAPREELCAGIRLAVTGPQEDCRHADESQNPSSLRAL